MENKSSYFKKDCTDYIQNNQNSSFNILNTTLNQSNFTITDQLIGQGTFGKVYKAYVNKNQQACAVKIVPTEYAKLIQNESNILKKLNHTNILRILGHYSDDDYEYVFTELCETNLLNELLEKQKGFNEKYVQQIIKQLLFAISHCHNKNIVHRDIKLENILLNKTQHGFHIKLADFGSSKQLVSKEDIMNINQGSLIYSAPEMFANYNYKCDMWQIGILTFALKTGEFPFDGNSDNEIFLAIQNQKELFQDYHKNTTSRRFRNFIKRLLRRNVNDRLDSNQALQDSFITHNQQQ